MLLSVTATSIYVSLMGGGGESVWILNDLDALIHNAQERSKLKLIVRSKKPENRVNLEIVGIKPNLVPLEALF